MTTSTPGHRVVLFHDAPADLRILADHFRALGADVVTLVDSNDSAAATQAVAMHEDWIPVLARSHRVPRSEIDAIEAEFRSLSRHCEVVVDGLDRHLDHDHSHGTDDHETGHHKTDDGAHLRSVGLVLLGRAAAIGALGLAGSYVAIHGGGPVNSVELIGYRHADALLTTSTGSAAELAARGVQSSGLIQVPFPPTLYRSSRSPGEFRPAPDALVIAATQPLNSDVSFVVLEAVAELKERLGSRRVVLAAPQPALPDTQTTGWVSGLKIDDSVVFYHGASETGISDAVGQADVLLATASDPGGVLHTASRAQQVGLGIASIFTFEEALDALAGYGDVTIRAGATRAELADCILTAVEDGSGHASPTSIHTELLRDQALGKALALSTDPGPNFRALRQKYWELVYEGESADGYDDKYHAGACYEALDRLLTSHVEATLPPSGTAAGAAQRRILDLGCGPGSMIPFLSKIDNVEITGVDVSPAMLRHARQNYPESTHPNVAFELGNTDALLFDDDYFDAVMISGVLHHLPVLRTTFDEIDRVLKPGGHLIVREPNEDNFAYRHPEIALAHQGIRSMVLDHFGHRPEWEPEAHEDHIDFTPVVLAASLATVFEVVDVSTAGVISYFHDTLNVEQSKLIDPLEATVAGQPGLNLLITARQSEEVGIASAAQDSLRALADQQPLSPGHVDAVIAAFGQLLELRPPEQSTIEQTLSKVRRELDDSALVLVAGDPHEIVGPGGSLEEGLPIADVVTVSGADAADAAVLELAASRLRDHGWLLIDLPAGAAPTPGRECDRLTAVGVEVNPDGSALVLARRNSLPPVDVVSSLENVLADASRLVEPVLPEQLEAWRDAVNNWRIAATYQWAPSAFRPLASLKDTVLGLTRR